VALTCPPVFSRPLPPRIQYSVSSLNSSPSLSLRKCAIYSQWASEDCIHSNRVSIVVAPRITFSVAFVQCSSLKSPSKFATSISSSIPLHLYVVLCRHLGTCILLGLLKAIGQAPIHPLSQYPDPEIIYSPQDWTLRRTANIIGSSPTLKFSPQRHERLPLSPFVSPHNGSFHPRSHPTSRNSRCQPSTSPRGIKHHHMDPVGAIFLRVCLIHNHLFITLEGSVTVW
jgi:hypothetical protein